MKQLRSLPRLKALIAKARVAPALVTALAAAAPAHAGTMMIGTYPDKLFTIDDTNGAITYRIQLQAGLPTSLRLSNDKA